jgi:CheY-like chemotaxis protein
LLTDEVGRLGAVEAERDSLQAQNELLREANQNLVRAIFDAQALRDEAETANQRQNEFLAMLAHELRNLLAPISMANAVLAKMPAPSTQLLNVQNIIVRQVKHLSRMLDDLLDAARISSGKITLSRSSVVLAELIERTVETVQVRINERGVARPRTVSSQQQRTAGPSRRILLVEDNLDASETLSMFLRSEGHAVVTAFDGPTGLATAHAQDFDVLICDIGLPGMNGYDLIRNLRGTVDANIPFAIAVSGYGQPEDKAHAIAAGFGQYLVKPVDVDALLNLIASQAVTRLVERK